MLEQTTFEKRIKPILDYVGMIGAVISSIAYIIIIFVLVNGFNQQEDLTKPILFAVVSAFVGFVIMQFLKIQGENFARELPKNKEITDNYYRTKTKDKKNHNMKFYWFTSVVKDALTKCVSVAITTFGMIYIVIEGTNDSNLLLLAAFNLLMFICFGILALVKTYDFYNTSYIPYVLEKIQEVNKNGNC